MEAVEVGLEIFTRTQIVYTEYLLVQLLTL